MRCGRTAAWPAFVAGAQRGAAARVKREDGPISAQGTREVHDGTHTAARLCQAVAELRPVPRQPVVLLGPAGSGKTDLLNSTARTLRARSSGVTLACVSAHHFADDVRALAGNPSAFAQMEHAVLLVDALERFESGSSMLVLERLVRLFLRHGHAVVMTSRTHPWTLANITEGLRICLAGGQVVELRAAHDDAAGSAQAADTRMTVAQLAASARRQAERAGLAWRRFHEALGQRDGRARDVAPLLKQARREQRAALDHLRTVQEQLAGAAEQLRRLAFPGTSHEAGMEEEASPDRLRALLATARRQAAQVLAVVEPVLAGLDRTLEGMEVQEATLERVARCLGRMRTELDLLHEHRRAAAAEAAGARAMAAQLESALAWAQAQQGALRRMLERALADAEAGLRVKGGAKTLAQRVYRLQQERDAQAGMARTLFARLARAQEETHRAGLELSALQDHNGALRDCLEADRGYLDGLREQLDTRNAALAELRKARARAQADADEARAMARGLEAQLSDTVRERDRLRAQIEREQAAQEHARAARENRPPDSVQRLPFGWQPVEREAVAAPANGQGLPLPSEKIVAFPPPKPRLGEMLNAAGKITSAQLVYALHTQSSRPERRLGALLVEMGYAEEGDVLAAVADQHGVAFIRLDNVNVHPEAACLLDPGAARKLRCIPIRIEDGELTLAVADPMDQRAMEAVSKVTRLRVRVVAAAPDDIERAQAHCYAA